MVFPHAHDTIIFLGSITVFDAIFTSRVGPPPFPRVFRAPTCEVCAMSLQDLINSEVSTLFCYFGKIGLDWLGKKCNKLRFYYQNLSNVGQPCRISPKKIRQFWNSYDNPGNGRWFWTATCWNGVQLSKAPTLDQPKSWHGTMARVCEDVDSVNSRIIVTSHWEVSRNLQLYPEYIRTAAQHMSTTSSPSTPIIEFKNGVNSNAKRQSVILRNMQGNMRIPPKTHKKTEVSIKFTPTFTLSQCCSVFMPFKAIFRHIHPESPNSPRLSGDLLALQGLCAGVWTFGGIAEVCFQ